MNGRSLPAPNAAQKLSASAAPPFEPCGSHGEDHDRCSERMDLSQFQSRRPEQLPEEKRYDHIGFPGQTYDRCPRRLLLFDASEASSAGKYVRLMGVIASVDQISCRDQDDAISVVIDDGTGVIEVVMANSFCFIGKGNLIQALGDGGTYTQREQIYPSNRSKRPFASSGKDNRPIGKRAKAHRSTDSELSLGQCVDCIGRLEFASDPSTRQKSNNLPCFRLVADSVSLVRDPNAMTLRHLEIMSQKRGSCTRLQTENTGDGTGIFMAGSLVSRLGTFCYPSEAAEKDSTAHPGSWHSPLRRPKKQSRGKHPQLIIRKNHLLRLIKCCSGVDGDSAGGISEADLLLILGCMDDGCPEEWAGVLREALEELKADGEIYVSRKGNFLPL